jgi:pre-rRNA-processing protein IPI3
VVTLSDHTLPITDIQVGFGPITTARIFSASMDGTVKVWTTSPITGQNGPAGALIATFAFPSPIQHLAMDPSERYFFAGSRKDSDEVYHVRMYQQKEGRFPEAIGGATAGASISVLGEEDSTSRVVLAGSVASLMGACIGVDLARTDLQ